MKGDLPKLALSVRQPWAWAIIHGGKDIENRTAGSIRAGNMTTGPIAIHAAAGMRQAEYVWAVWKMQQVGVTVPRPDALVRSAIIGWVEVVDIVSEKTSPWFGGPCGLVLRNPVAIDPIPAKGALGYFAWEQAGDFALVPKWMQTYGRAGGDADTPDLFGDAAPQFAAPPPKPFVTRKER